MRKFGLIGYPLGHSFSKKYFTKKFLSEKVEDCSYELYPLPGLDHFMPLITDDPELCGLNVTIPYKSEIINYIDYIDTEAFQIGAVNVLKIKRPGTGLRIHGYNSDVTGIRETLAPWLNCSVKRALVLGTGGSSLAVCFVLKKHGIDVLQVSRTNKPGMITYKNIDKGIIEDHKLIINTTPLGMFPDVDAKPEIDYDKLSNDHILFDLVYNPEETAFLKMGKERGCITLSGLAMLYSQAERSWEIWNDPNL